MTLGFSRAGFAHQGPKEKKLLKEKKAFNISSFVLRSMMNGQYWPEGDEVYHAELTVPILLVHGMYDRFVQIQEDQRMAEVNILVLSVSIFFFYLVVETNSIDPDRYYKLTN